MKVRLAILAATISICAVAHLRFYVPEMSDAAKDRKSDNWNLTSISGCKKFVEVLALENVGKSKLQGVVAIGKTPPSDQKPQEIFRKYLARANHFQLLLDQTFPDIFQKSFSREYLNFLIRIHEILFAEGNDGGYEPYGKNTIWKSNQGISGHLGNGLVLDSHYLEIVQAFLAKLGVADKAFHASVLATREKAGVPMTAIDPLQQKLQTVDYQPGDPAGKELYREFDPLIEMIQTVREVLPLELRNNPVEVRRYVFRLLLFFHDDANQFDIGEIDYARSQSDFISVDHGRKVEEVMRRVPGRISLLYTNWAGIEEKETIEAIISIRAELEKIHGKAGYRLSAFRYGYYHSNAAAALNGLTTEGLFLKSSLGEKLVSATQARMAAVYRYMSADVYRDETQKKFFEHIKKHHKILTGKLATGFLRLSEVMKGSLFDDLLTNRKGKWDELVKKLSLDMDDSKARDQLRTAILSEQLLWLQALRAVEQHRMGIHIAKNIGAAVDRDIEGR